MESVTQQYDGFYCPACGASAVEEAPEINVRESLISCHSCNRQWSIRRIEAFADTASVESDLPKFRAENIGRSDEAESSLRLCMEPRSASPHYRNLSELTDRQRQVMELVVDGKANKQTAHILSISEKTVEKHRANVMRKLNASSLADLIRIHMISTDFAEPSIDDHRSAQTEDVNEPLPDNLRVDGHHSENMRSSPESRAHSSYAGDVQAERRQA